MAVHWLDLVRYADTVGYHGDPPMNVYPFRDWVIRSFNENKPFDVVHARATGRRPAARPRAMATRGQRLQPPEPHDE